MKGISKNSDNKSQPFRGDKQKKDPVIRSCNGKDINSINSDNHFNLPGVLLSDQIEHYATEKDMIKPFNKDNLKAASYYLTVGGEKYYIDGEKKVLGKNSNSNYITIKPFQVAVIETTEELQLPKDIIGRWNIRVSQAYAGLVWVGGPQVDPNYKGRLSCPIYNLSNNIIILKRGEELATIDFIRTTPFVEGKSKIQLYDNPDVSRFNPENTTSALSKKLSDFENNTEKIKKEAQESIEKIKKEAQESIENIKDGLDENRRRTDRFVWGIFTTIAVLITALAIMVSNPGTSSNTADTSLIWVYMSFIPSSVAILLSIWAITKCAPRNQEVRVPFSTILIVLIIVALILTLFLLILTLISHGIISIT